MLANQLTRRPHNSRLILSSQRVVCLIDWGAIDSLLSLLRFRIARVPYGPAQVWLRSCDSCYRVGNQAFEQAEVSTQSGSGCSVCDGNSVNHNFSSKTRLNFGRKQAG